MAEITEEQARKIADRLNIYKGFATEYQEDEEDALADRCWYGIERMLDVLRILDIPFSQNDHGEFIVSA